MLVIHVGPGQYAACPLSVPAPPLLSPAAGTGRVVKAIRTHHDSFHSERNNFQEGTLNDDEDNKHD
jgi:hypothetical protein